MTPLKIWLTGRSVLGRSCLRPKYFWAEVGIRPKYHWGQNIPQAKMCLKLKYVWGQMVVSLVGKKPERNERKYETQNPNHNQVASRVYPQVKPWIRQTSQKIGPNQIPFPSL